MWNECFQIPNSKFQIPNYAIALPAGVVKLADARDSKSSATEDHEGSHAIMPMVACGSFVIPIEMTSKMVQ